VASLGKLVAHVLQRKLILLAVVVVVDVDVLSSINKVKQSVDVRSR
jgi:hypothetical protein